MPTPVVPQNITTDIDCDECGKPMIIRKGRRGPFLGCSGYPKCKNTSEVPAKLLEEMGLNGKRNGKAEVDSKPIPLPPEQEHEDAA
jgi:ssDNA-binding Zn-finger/Zn-ribbon topoisomerase 1